MKKYISLLAVLTFVAASVSLSSNVLAKDKKNAAHKHQDKSCCCDMQSSKNDKKNDCCKMDSKKVGDKVGDKKDSQAK